MTSVTNSKKELLDQIESYENKNKLKEQVHDKNSYYYSDEMNNRVLANNLIYIDIKSAFPTLCNILFKTDTEFISALNSKETKLEKNIYISTHLKSEQLSLLNYLCKVLVLNYTNTNYEVINILEYVKDGIIIDGYQVNNIEFSNINFKIEKLDYYCRFSKTSFYYKNKKLEVKGNFKNPPPYIINNILNLIFEKHDYYNKEFYNLKVIYSDLFLNILKTNGLFNLVKHYYMFDNKYFIDSFGGRFNNLNKLIPENTLRYFIYPLLYLFRTFNN